MKLKPFKDRVQAGRLLADALVKYADRDDVIVLGLPRGGVPVAYEVAEKLHAPLDVIVVRKLGAVGWEELAMGAVASGDITVINDDVVRQLRISSEAIAAEIARETKELHRREIAYRGHTGAPAVTDKCVILVDDGIATGSTMQAAVRALRQLKPRLMVIAVPVVAPDSFKNLEPMADECVALMQPDNFIAVGRWYENFAQTSDEEVNLLLAKARHRISQTTA